MKSRGSAGGSANSKANSCSSLGRGVSSAELSDTKPLEYMGYHIADAKPGGGKAGRGKNKTSSMQVRDYASFQTGYAVVYKTSFNPEDITARYYAIERCKDWIMTAVALKKVAGK